MIISGTELAKETKQDVARRVAEAKEKYGRAPHLVVILVGEDPASQSYVKGKVAALKKLASKTPQSCARQRPPKKRFST